MLNESNSIDLEHPPINHNQDIKSRAAKLLDSSTASDSVPGTNSEPRYDEEIEIVSNPHDTTWYFLLLRSKQLRYLSDLLNGRTHIYTREQGVRRRYTFRFPTFVYTAADHISRMKDCDYSEAEYQKRKIAAYNAALGIDQSTAGDITRADRDIHGGGYLFVRGSVDDINRALQTITPRHYLITDKATHRAAMVPPDEMKHFTLVYELAPWSVRFLEEPIYKYARGHQLMRITGGVLQGAEGYLVRMHKDRKLIFSFGNMTLAVSEVHSFPMEPIGKITI